MRGAVARVLAILLCGSAIACGSNGPNGPSGANYRGDWAGTTGHGAPISFTISSDEKVTAITVGYNFNGCSGSHTFANLNLDIAPDVICIPGPCPGSLSSFRRFSYSTTGSLGDPITTVHGVFLTTGRAEGAAYFRDYPSCGTANAVSWAATKR
jgi:hypothetical protein